MDIEFEKEAYEGMRFKIFEMPGDQSVFKVYPELAQRKDLHIKPPKKRKKDKASISGDQVLRYLIYLYDEGSPLGGIDDINVRKRKALELTHIDTGTDDRYSEYMDEVIGGTEPRFNAAVISFLRILKNTKWAYIKVIEKLYYALLERANNGELVSMTEIDKSRRQLDSLVAEYFGAISSQSLINQFYDYVLAEDVDISVEDVVPKLNAGEEVFPEILAYEKKQAGVGE